MTPLAVEILLHCRVSATPFPRAEAPACKEVIAQFLALGVIRATSGSADMMLPMCQTVYEVTPLGRAWVTEICNVPAPRMVFLNAQGEVIEV